MERNYHKTICVIALLAFLFGVAGTQSASAAEAGAAAVHPDAGDLRGCVGILRSCLAGQGTG